MALLKSNMEMNMIDLPAELQAFVDQPRVATAESEFSKAKKRQHDAGLDALAARRVLADAEAASASAIAGEGGDPHAAEVDLEDAERKSRVADKRLAHADRAVELAAISLQRETGLAHTAVYKELVARRFQAALDRDQALENIKAADARHAEATRALVEIQTASAYKQPVDPAVYDHENRGLARELAIWNDATAAHLVPDEFKVTA